METTAKTLGESYEGCLSRDWEKLLTILESGERRVMIYTTDFTHSTKGIVKVHHLGIASCHIENGKVEGYDIAASFPPDYRKWMIEWIDKSVVGWFPTKEDAPNPVVTLPPLRWCYEDGFSKNLKARDEWPTSNGCTASGHIRYTIDTEGYWRIFPEGSLGGGFAHGYEADQDAAIGKIEKWREANMYMPLMRPTKEDEL